MIARVTIAIALTAVACGGGAKQARIQSSSGSADPATIRALLARYAPSGHAIVTAFEALPTTFELPEGPYVVTSSDTFDGYLRDGALDLLVTYTSTAVHEITHGYIGHMAFQLQAERALPYGEGALAILADGEPWLVLLTPTFPSAELDATFPADARTARYAEYIAGSVAPELATQSQGVYGMLDEYSAYYQGSRTVIGFWPWVRDEAPHTARLIMNYAVLLDEIQRSYGDFTLYLLHYLLHAREHQPDVHDALLANTELRTAFLGVHDAFTDLVASALALEPSVHAFARTHGVELERRGADLVIDGNPQRSEQSAAIHAVLAHLDDEAYLAELEALR